MEYAFRAPLWIYAGQAAWHFVTLPQDISSEIKEIYGSNAAGFGSIKVKVTIGETNITTSIFPDKKSGCYFLPVKKQVRVAENLSADQLVAVKLTISIQ